MADIPVDLCKGLICVQVRLDHGAPVTLMLEASMDFIAISAHDMATGGAFQGNLIYLLFKDRALQIDYPRRRLRISAALTGPPRQADGRLEIVNFHKWGPPIVVGGPFIIDGRSVRAQIDTGYTGSMLIYSAAIKRLGLSGPAAHGRREFFPFTDSGVTMLAASTRSEGFAGRILRRPAVVYFPTRGVHEPENPFDATDARCASRLVINGERIATQEATAPCSMTSGVKSR